MRATLLALLLVSSASHALAGDDRTAQETLGPCEAAALLEQSIHTDVGDLARLRRLYADGHPDILAKRRHLGMLRTMRSAEMADAAAQNLRCSPNIAGSSRRLVDLNRPGAMDRLKKDNPAHYEAVRAILDSASTMPEAKAAYFLLATYDVNVSFGAVVLTSDPPKTDLSFRLDDVEYRSRVTLRVSATPEPAASR